VSFGAIGATSTVVSLVIYLALRSPIGPIAANAVAVTATFAANTWAHARFTQQAARPRWRRALAVYAGSLVATTVALWAVGAAGLGLPAELAALALTWSAAALVRLAVLQPRVRRTVRAS